MKKATNSLFWRLSIFFFLTLIILAGIFVYITYHSSMEYSQETSQKLNHSLAKRIAAHTQTFVDGELNEEETKELFHNVMVLNPSVEIYLLDFEGQIMTYYAPFGEVKLEKLDLDPIKIYLNDEEAFVKGEDPRNPGVYKVFSAATIKENDVNSGYIYVILASQEYTTVVSMLDNSFKMKLATKSFFITGLFTLIIGVVIIWYLTRNLNPIISKVKAFKQGDLTARIKMKANKGELTLLANNFDSMADTIVENLNEIKSVENLRKELITNVSHDLRTPLTSIRGYAETLVMLKDELSADDYYKYTNYILTSTDKVIKLVDDLFEISKLESRHIKTKIEKFSVEEMISDVVSKFELISKSKDVDISFRKNKLSKEHPMIKADIALIDRVMQNLLDNAIKHSPPGSEIIIEIKSVDDELQIAIKDTGFGIPEEELPYIFDRYKKAKGNKQTGSGLGLAIVKKILELHETEIRVRSIVNKGTTFSFNLPLV